MVAEDATRDEEMPCRAGTGGRLVNFFGGPRGPSLIRTCRLPSSLSGRLLSSPATIPLATSAATTTAAWLTSSRRHFSAQQLAHRLQWHGNLPDSDETHAQACAAGASDDPRAISKLLQSSDNLDHAVAAFESAINRTTFLWNSMIQACCRLSSPGMAVCFYARMVGEGRRANFFTYPSLISACWRLPTGWEGGQIHSHVLKMGFDADWFLRSSLIHMYSCFGDMTSAQNLFDEMPPRNVVVWTALINGYSKLGDLDNARRAFDRLPEKDAVTWSAMVTGYVQNGKFAEGLGLFREMLSLGVRANEGVLVSVLSACAHMGSLHMGKWVHFYVERRFGLELSVNLGTSLVDLYAKCGVLSAALNIFQDMPCRNVWSWNAMMGGFSLHGHGWGALCLFGKMLISGFVPDKVTFLGLLGAFSHSGMVEDGKAYFKAMSRYFSIEPSLEHYASMVDILARAGLLKEAMQVVQAMPMEPDACVWGALLGGCRMHGNASLGSHIGQKLVDFEPNRAGSYVLLSNIYASARQWKNAKHVRSLMSVRGARPQTGFSSIEINGVVHEFVVGDKRHPQTIEIYKKLEEMFKRLRNAGYTVDTGDALHDLDEEDKELQLAYHSERLAIAFGLITLEARAPIRIVKNLRICGDCHVVTKMLSKIYEREIIVRDRKRFHYFNGGSCSCLDYW